MLRGMRLAFAGLALLALGAGAKAVEADAAINAFVQRINATTGAATPGDKAGIRAACQALVVEAFDFPAVAPAASFDTWKRMNAGQKERYLAALIDRAASQCASRGKEVAGQPVEIVGIRPGKDGEQQVAVQRADKTGRVAIWKLVSAGDAVRAVDIVVDGHSMVADARNQAKQILSGSNNSVEVLIKAVSR